MTSLDRLLVVIVSVLLFAEGFVLAAALIRHEALYWLERLLEQEALGARPGIILVICAIFFLAFLLLRLGAGRFQDDRAIVRGTSLGEVRISLIAIENLIRRVARQVSGVREVETTVNLGEEGIQASLSIMVAPDTNIPAICEELQSRIEHYMRDTVGVNTLSTRISVKNISGAESRARVE